MAGGGVAVHWVAAGAALAALAVMAGAFGAHGLAPRLSAGSLALWETAARYLMYAALSLILVGLSGVALPRRGVELAAWSLLAGGVIFSGTVAALALGAPRWLGAVTPLGGLLLIAGYLVVAASALRAGGH